MAAEKSLSTPVAILIAGALIAASLFFGLRGREPPAAGGPASPLVAGHAPIAASSPATSSPAAVSPPSPPPAVVSLDRAAVTAAAMKDLERYRADIVKKCVEPALAKKPAPPRIKLTFNVAFDPEGKQVARGVAEDRETMREGVSTCAMDAIPGLSVPAPGAPVSVELPWTLP